MKRCSRNSVAWAFSILIWGLSFSPTAQAQELEFSDVEEPCAPEVEENRTAVVTHEGDSGLWYHSEVARCLLVRQRAFPLYVRRVSLLEHRLALSDERYALLRRQASLATQEAEAASQALEAAVRRTREAEEALDSWTRHPAVWFTVGIVATVALQVVAIWALSALR